MNHITRSSIRVFTETKKVILRASTNDTLDKRICLSCKLTSPSFQELITLMKERKIVSFHQITKSEDNRGCKFLNTFEFKTPKNCFLAEELLEIALKTIKTFPDIKYSNGYQVYLEALKIPPKGTLGDLTGDYGKETVKFLTDCFQNQFKFEVGSMIDVGGRSHAAVHLIRNFLKNPEMPALINDINILTPFLSEFKPNMFYAIGDAKSFFQSNKYNDAMNEIENKKPTLFLLSNFLSVLKASYGWETLEVCWSRLRIGDVMILSNVVAKPLEKQNMIRALEKDGLVEFKSKLSDFYKTAISPEFLNYLEKNLKTKVLYHIPYEYAIETKREVIGSVTGLHILVIKKI